MPMMDEGFKRRPNLYTRYASSGPGLISDLRRMLAVLASGIEALESANDRRGTDLRGGMKRAVHNAVRLTNELGRLEREMLGPVEPVAVEPFAKEFEGLSRAIVPDSATLSVHVAPGTRPIRVNRRGLDTALMALVKNSIEAISPGGEIQVRIANNPGAGSVRFEVRDNGEGIRPDDLDLVFTPFFSGKKQSQRLGLGLTRAWRFATQLGGSIRLESVPGWGSTVVMELPGLIPHEDDPPLRLASGGG